MKKTTILDFGRGAFFDGQLDTKITTTENQDYVEVNMLTCNCFCRMPDQKYIMPVSEVGRIAELIKTISQWEKRYKKTGILDGYGWHIEFHFGDTDFHSSGYEDYPENYSEKVSELQTIIEDLCRKYNPDGYDENGRQARIEL